MEVGSLDATVRRWGMMRSELAQKLLQYQGMRAPTGMGCVVWTATGEVVVVMAAAVVVVD